MAARSCGSATRVAARAAGRDFIGIDLTPEYCRIAERRIAGERVDPYAFLLEKPRARKAKSSRQMRMFDEQPREPALPDDDDAESEGATSDDGGQRVGL